MTDILWQCLPYSALSPDQLYAILRLRSEVFVVEQDCAYLDMDDRDQSALHVIGSRDDVIHCYARLLAPGAKYDEASIGRVITRQTVRGTGAGKELLRLCITHCLDQWPDAGIRISAQQYLEQFYTEQGFTSVSEPYLEDNIPHIEMLRKA